LPRLLAVALIVAGRVAASRLFLSAEEVGLRSINFDLSSGAATGAVNDESVEFGLEPSIALLASAADRSFMCLFAFPSSHWFT